MISPPSVTAPTGSRRLRSRWPLPVQLVVAPVLLYVAVYAPLPLTLLPPVAALADPQAPLASGVAVLVALSVLTLVVAVAGVALVARLDGGRRLRELGLRSGRGSTRAHLRGLLIGLAVAVPITLGVALPLTWLGLLRDGAVDVGGAGVGVVLLVGLVRAFVLQAMPEELIFRGYLLTALRDRLSDTGAVVVSAGLFAVLHLTSSGGQQGWGERLLYLLLPFGFALAAGALRLVTGSLWAAVGVHGGMHLALLAGPVFGPVWPLLEPGNGPALWAAAGVVFALVGLVLLRVRSSPAASSAPGR